MKKYILFIAAAISLLCSCVKDPVPVVSITVDKQSHTMTPGSSFVIKAIVSPSNADNQKVIWSVTNSSVIDYVDHENGSATITATGVGSARVIARTDDGGIQAFCDVLVGAGVDKITLDKSELTLKKGESASLTATVSPADATDKSLKWGTSDSSVATVDADGKVTAVSSGEATIFVASTDGGYTAYCNVKVHTPVTSINVNPGEYTLESIGSSFTVEPVVYPEDATDKSVTWASSDPKVATVSSDGSVTAVGPGAAVITATTVDGSLSSKCVVTVNSPAQHISLNKSSLSVVEGSTGKLTATIYPSNSTQNVLSWTSSDSNVVSVDQQGNITGVKAGTATITVSVSAGVAATCEVTVVSKMTALTISETSRTLEPSESFHLSASVIPEDASHSELSWTSSDPSVAAVDGGGKVTALKPGNALITVSVEEGFSKTCMVIVEIPANGVVLNDTAVTLNPTESYQLIARIVPADAVHGEFSWTSTDPSVVSVDATGKITAHKPGKAQVTVSVPEGLSTSCVVTVEVPASSISLNETTVTLMPSEKFQLVANIVPADAVHSAFLWNSSDPSVVSVDATGKITAIKPGKALITVSVAEGPSKACMVIVEIPATGVSLSENAVTLNPAGSCQLLAKILPAGAVHGEFSWTSSDSSVATVDASGKVTGVKPGKAVVTVSVPEGFKADCEVTVVGRVSSITLNEKSILIKPKGTYQLTATVLPENATDKSVSWYSDNTSIVTVSSTGLVTAVGSGKTTVHAVTSDGGKMATCEVNVSIPVTKISLSKTSATLYVGDESMDITASITPSDATDRNIRWSSSDESVAVVIPGALTYASINPLKAGTAVITVTSVDGGFTSTCKVTVKQHVESVSLNKSATTLYVGQSETLAATVGPDDASDKAVSWSSSDASVATVSTSGKITAMKAGTAVIKVKTKEGSKEASCTVTVKQHVTAVTVNPSNLTLNLGESKSLSATVSPSDASDKSVTWSSSNTAVAVVNQSGFVTSKGLGTAVITATSADGGLTSTCNVTVKEAIIYATSLSLTPAKTTLELNEKSSIKLSYSPANFNEELEWSSSNPSVVTVENGDIEAVGVGTATITVKGKNTSASTTITVKDRYAVTGVKLDRQSVSIVVGETETLTPEISPADARDKSVRWESSNESVATVDNGVITAVSSGSAVITVITNSGSFKATCNVEVLDKLIPITEISYPEQNTTIEINQGESYTITATVNPSDANEQIQISPAVNCPVTYTAKHDKGSPYWYITVTALKNKTGRGSFSIDAANYSTLCYFNVSKIDVEEVLLDETEMSMRVGQTATLMPTVKPYNASNQGITWSSNDTSVAYVSQSGVITAKKAGKVVITATSKDNTSIRARCTILIRDNTVNPGNSEGVGFIDWN